MASTYSSGLPAVANVDLIISRGADNVFKFNWSTSDGATPPTITPVNLNGYTAAAQIRSFVGGDIWATLTTAAGITLDASGNITITLAHATTSVSAWDVYSTGVWDLELTSGGGIVTRFLEGAVTLSQDVTR